MGNINVGTLYRKSILRDTKGNIINWLDESDGGYIIRNRQVVNQAKYDEYLRKEQDKRTAAQAVTVQVKSNFEAQRSGAIRTDNTKVEDLEKKVNSMDDKLNAILAKLK
jgi:hypothetical protein